MQYKRLSFSAIFITLFALTVFTRSALPDNPKPEQDIYRLVTKYLAAETDGERDKFARQIKALDPSPAKLRKNLAKGIEYERDEGAEGSNLDFYTENWGLIEEFLGEDSEAIVGMIDESSNAVLGR